MLSNKLKTIIKERDINVNQLADETDISFSNIYKIINGVNANPGIYTVKKIADYLGLTLNDLI